MNKSISIVPVVINIKMNVCEAEMTSGYLWFQ